MLLLLVVVFHCGCYFSIIYIYIYGCLLVCASLLLLLISQCIITATTTLLIYSSENSVVVIGGGLAGVSAGKNDGCYIVLIA